MTHDDYMELCLALARRGLGWVHPNPMVGCLLVKRGKIIGQGYHEYFGGPHAEVNTVRNATRDVRGADLYVNLEPCNIFGKTPPCTDLIIKSGIGHVYIGTKDPNPQVSGGGIRQLRKAGIGVTAGILSDECRHLNAPFFKFMKTGLPYVSVKVAQTLDGKIADLRGSSKWISNSASRKFAHTLRSRYDAILAGAGTVRKDNPRLTVRLSPGRNPLRVIVDGKFALSQSSSVFSHQGQAPTLLLCDQRYLAKSPSKKRFLEKQGVNIRGFRAEKPGRISPNDILRYLGSEGISSVLVEGGAEMISLFLHHGIVDKIYAFISPKMIGRGISATEYLPVLRLDKAIQVINTTVVKIKNDLLIEGELKKH